MRTMVLALAILVGGSTSAPAQNASWLDKMFKGDIAHDFGTVAHGAQLYHRFPMTNIWAVPLELVSIRTSCGCVTAKPSVQILQSREIAYLEVSMDARRFTGPKTVNLYITVGPQYTSTTTLRVSANSRADVVFNPGQIDFGVVQRGQTPVQTMEVEYAGTLDWKVNEVDTSGAPLDVTLEEMYRRPGQVGYRLRTTLKAEAPAGLLKQELMLKTNDPTSPLVPVLVEGTIQAPLTVKPNPLQMGVAQLGATVTKRVNVYGPKPFKIVGIDGLGDGVGADLPQVAAPVQTITVTFQPAKAGELHRQIQIKTDLPGQAPVTVLLEGTGGP